MHESPSPPALSHRREREPVEEYATNQWRTLETAAHKPGALGSLVHKRVYTHTNGDATPDAVADYTYGYDAVGNVYCAWDDDGNEVFYFAQDAFGNELPVDLYGQDSWSDARTLGVSEHQTGKWIDPFTGLYFFHARYYDPMVGRFVGRDLAQSNTSHYQFCSSLPTALYDANGLYEIEAYEIKVSEWGLVKVPRPDIVSILTSWMDAIVAADSNNGNGFPCCREDRKWNLSENMCIFENEFHDWIKEHRNSIAMTAMPLYNMGAVAIVPYHIYLDIDSIGNVIDSNLLVHEWLHKYKGWVRNALTGHKYEFLKLVKCVTAKAIHAVAPTRRSKESCCGNGNSD